jgi:hypothetical protein
VVIGRKFSSTGCNFPAILEASIDGTLDRIELKWSKMTSVCVVLASAGYPGGCDGVGEGFGGRASGGVCGGRPDSVRGRAVSARHWSERYFPQIRGALITQSKRGRAVLRRRPNILALAIRN